jgi:hypothetical protein
MSLKELQRAIENGDELTPEQVDQLLALVAVARRFAGIVNEHVVAMFRALLVLRDLLGNDEYRRSPNDLDADAEIQAASAGS